MVALVVTATASNDRQLAGAGVVAAIRRAVEAVPSWVVRFNVTDEGFNLVISNNQILISIGQISTLYL